LKKARAK